MVPLLLQNGCFPSFHSRVKEANPDVNHAFLKVKMI